MKKEIKERLEGKKISRNKRKIKKKIITNKKK